jgi:2-polyprenyl-3-methyl-5-hydroxy-6-metoxy-1,4-benzoquinol methylase
MFNRPPQTYEMAPGLVENIVKEEANPLNRICALIPAGSTVLDIGAGNGLMALLLKKHGKPVIIDGIEPSPQAAALASPHYRRFYTGYARDFAQKITETDYDFIILADVIEHMADPLTFLRDLSSRIGDRTRLVLSVPNVAFGAVRLALLGGRFEYVDSGLLERTHLRFFTLATLERIIREIGMYAEKIYFLRRNIFATEIDLRNLGVNPLCLGRMFRDELAWTYQFLLVLTREPVTTERRSFGKKGFLPFLRYVFRKTFIQGTKE